MRRRRQIFAALRSVRLSTLQLAAVTAVSLVATVIVIVNANGKTGLDESAVLAALDKKVDVHRLAAPSGGGSTAPLRLPSIK